MNKNHAVCIPLPLQGHIRPMLKLAQILHFKFNFHITFINTHHNHKSLFHSFSQPCHYYNNNNTLENTNNNNNNDNDNNNNINSSFNLESLPQGIGEPKDVLNSVLDGDLAKPLKEMLLKLAGYSGSREENNGRPKVSCMVTDVAMLKLTMDVAEEIGIPAVVMETGSASGMMAYLQIQKLFDKGIIPLKDKNYLINGYLDMEIEWIQSLKGIRLKDMPTSSMVTDPKDKLMNHIVSSEYKALNSRAIIINTFEALEQDVLKELSSFSPNIYPIGPLNIFIDNIPKANTMRIGPLQDVNGDIHHSQWLDSQESNSILYVNFGTLATLTKDQVVEIAWGLANSHIKFFWIIRPDLVISESNFISLEFAEEIKERGIIASWCNQERVLSHPSIGGFLTHCGWNSMIESISNGVPMICLPLFADQSTNSFYCCNYLNIGIKLSEVVERNDVAKIVKELMKEEKGKELKKRAMEWKNFAKEATICPNGSSYANLESIVNNVLLSNCTT